MIEKGDIIRYVKLNYCFDPNLACDFEKDLGKVGWRLYIFGCPNFS